MEALIPGLPDDIAEECLKRVAYHHLFTLHSVCRRWSEHVRTPYFYHRRRLAGITRRLFVIVERSWKLNSESSPHEPDFSLTLFDPILATCHSLPPIPGLLNLHGVQIVGIGSQLLAIGRHHHFSVSIYNYLTGTWREGASIPCQEKLSFLCVWDGVKHVYVVGGYGRKYTHNVKSFMRYDVQENRWEPLTVMTERNGFYTVCAFHLGKFYLLKKLYNNSIEISKGKYSWDVYDVASREWCLVELIKPVKMNDSDDKYARKCDEFAFAPDGKIYCCRKGRNLLVKEGENWPELTNLPDDSRNSVFLCCWEGGVSAIRLRFQEQLLSDRISFYIPVYNAYIWLLEEKHQKLPLTTSVFPTTGAIDHVFWLDI